MGLLDTIVRNIGYTNPFSAIPTAIYNKVTTGEFVPGIDVGGTLKKGTGADTFSDITFKGGDRTPLNNKLVGLQTPGNYATMNPKSNQYEVTGGSNSGDIYNPSTGQTYPATPSPGPTGPTQAEINAEQERQAYEQYIAEQKAAAAAAAAEEARIAREAAAKKKLDTENEVGAYNSQISNLDKLLGYTNTQETQGVQSINDLYDYNKGLQDKSINAQRLSNTQAKEKGYDQVGTFANTSMGNLNRLLQGNNAGRSAVGQILAPYMVGRSADTRRQGVTDTAGENEVALQTAQTTGDQQLENTKKNSTQSFLDALLNQRQSLESQKISAQIARDMADGSNFKQAQANASGLTANMDARQSELAGLFDKYKPNYTINEAPELSKYAVDPALIKSQQANPTESSFYAQQLKKKRELGL